MGAWGTGILQNDTTADVWAEFKQLYNLGSTGIEIRKQLEKEYEIDSSSDIYADFWTGIAHGQWSYGELETYVLDKLKAILDKEYGLELWQDDEKQFKNRLKSIQNFYDKIQVPKEKPNKRRRLVRNPSYFQKGDVLSIELDTREFVGALVFDESDDEIYGSNWIVFFDLISNEKINISQLKDANIFYLDLGGRNEYHRGYFWAQFEAKNMKRKIKKTQIIDNIKFDDSLSLSDYVPYGDWNELKDLFDEQRKFQESNLSRAPKIVSFKEFINGDIEPLTSELKKHANEIWNEKLQKMNAT
ncbi:MAG: hypothetical protein JXQ87_19630 [Bacteroidia bacterium]